MILLQRPLTKPPYSPIKISKKKKDEETKETIEEKTDNGASLEDTKKIRKESMISYSITDEEAVMEFAKLVLYLSTARSTGFIYPLDFGTI